MKIKSIVLSALFCAVLCILSPLSLPVNIIPITLATFALYLTASLLPVHLSLISTLCYILLGTVGLPVFSGWRGGFQIIAGPTGGYIIGYIPCAVIISLLCTAFAKKKFVKPLSMVAGTAVLYVIGSVWYMIQTQSGIGTTFMMCVFPFLAGDAIKILAASYICIQCENQIKKLL